MAKLCARGVKAAKAKFDKWPSAYASGYAAQVCKGTKPDSAGKTKKSSAPSAPAKGGLKEWFGEKWVDVSRGTAGNHPPCGRPKAGEGKYPACRPAKAAANMSAKEKAAAGARKASTNPAAGKKPTRISYPVTPSGRRKKT